MERSALRPSPCATPPIGRPSNGSTARDGPGPSGPPRRPRARSGRPIAITRSMSLPMARMPAPCISRLFVGGFPQASGNVSRTASQYDHEGQPDPRGVHLAGGQVPVLEQAPGCLLQALLESVHQARVSHDGGLPVLSRTRRPLDKPLERRVILRVEQVAERRRHLRCGQAWWQWTADLRQEFGDQALRQWLRGVDPHELVALHVDRVGDERVDRDREVLPLGPGQREGPLLPVDYPAWLASPGPVNGISIVPPSAMPSLTLGPRLPVHRTVDGSAMMMGFGNSTSSPSR